MAETNTTSATTAVTMRLMQEGGQQRIPVDSGTGGLNRPFARGTGDGRVASLETLYEFWINNVPDPDSALAQNPNFDEVARQQPDVHACMRLRELTVAKCPANILPSTDKSADPKLAIQVADYVNDVLNGLSNRVNLYQNMQQAVLLGGQGIEFTWANVNGFERPVDFYPVHKSRFVFDRMGNLALLTRTTPVWGSYVQSAPHRTDANTPPIAPKKFKTGEMAFHPPRGKFIYHKYMSGCGSWHRPADEGYIYYGRGEDTYLYIPVTFDQFCMRFNMKAIERGGMPLAVLTYPDSDGISSQVESIAKSIRGEGVVSIPRQVGQDPDGLYKLEFPDISGDGGEMYERFYKSRIKPAIEKILLGGADLLEQSEKGGYASSVAQRSSGPAILFEYDCKNIDETINLQLIPSIVQARFRGLGSEYFPKHALTPERSQDQALQMEVLTAGAALVKVPESYIYAAMGANPPKKNEQTGEMEPSVFIGAPEGGMGRQPRGPGGTFGKKPTSQVKQKKKIGGEKSPRKPEGGKDSKSIGLKK